MRIRRNRSNTKLILLTANITVLVIILAMISGFFVSKYLLSHSPAGKQQKSTTNANLSGVSLYTDPQSPAAQQAAAWRATQPENARYMDALAQLPVALWATEASSSNRIAAHVQAAAEAKKVPVLVSYYFPKRDCGRYSTGGAQSPEDYKAYIAKFAGAIGRAQAIVILEPDAVPNIKGADDQGQPCLSADDQDEHYLLLEHAVTTLKALPGVSLYIDAGNSEWIKDTNEVAARLKRAGVAKADGFSLNVSNFQTNSDTIAYGNAISSQVDGKNFVIDTSRNGAGPYANAEHPTHNWCNPPGRALGHYPTTATENDSVDAYLFIKRPGESDGADPNPQKCFDGPRAGEWWAEYAVGLVQRWPKELQPDEH